MRDERWGGEGPLPVHLSSTINAPIQKRSTYDKVDDIQVIAVWGL